jgi:hypothetical protein
MIPLKVRSAPPRLWPINNEHNQPKPKFSLHLTMMMMMMIRIVILCAFLQLLQPAIGHPEREFDSSFLSEVQRQLEVLSVTDFCSNLGPIETFVANRLLENIPSLELLTEEGNYVCSCLVQEDVYVDLECGTFFMQDVVPTANVEYMRLILGEDGVYTPESVGRCQYLEGTIEGSSYCEDFILNLEDPTILDACFFTPDFDTRCDAGATECEICEGGQTVAFTSPEECNIVDVTCPEEYSGSFLFEYHTETPINLVNDEQPVGCVDAPSVDDFCEDLSEIETNLTQTFRTFLPELDIILPYECSCVLDDNSTSLTLLGCVAIYMEGLNRTRRSTETIGFKEQNGYIVPSQMQWCEFNVRDADDVYCESFDFAFLQNELSYCEIDGCGAAFCELCSDGLSIAHTCFPDFTCKQSIPGAFLFLYKDTKLAVEQCAPTDATVTVTDVPSMAPSNLPTMPPANPTMAPIQKTLRPTPAATEGDDDVSLALELNGLVSVLTALATITAQLVI